MSNRRGHPWMVPALLALLALACAYRMATATAPAREWTLPHLPVPVAREPALITAVGQGVEVHALARLADLAEELARQEALRVLADRGLAPIEALGRLFDPREHEAAGTVFDPTRPEGTVVTELRRGYRLRDRVVRPARVQIAVSPTDQKETD